MKSFIGRHDKKPLSGTALIDDFLVAVTNLSTMHTAQYLAKQSEQAVLDRISQTANQLNSSEGQSKFLNEETIKQSLDAHVKKVQAEQISSLALQETTQHELIDSQQYRGKFAVITITDNSMTPFEAAWLDEQTGEYTVNPFKVKTIRGTIDDLSLAKNMLVIKPSIVNRTLAPGRKYFLVHVIDLHSLTPAVSIQIRS